MISFINQILWNIVCSALLFVYATDTFAGEEWPVSVSPPISENTQVCILCHKNYTPGIVEDWLKSRHSVMSPEMAIKQPLLEKRVSGGVIPEALRSTVVGCYECHSLNASAHKDNFDHFGFRINVVVSPNDCSTCHPVEAEQYAVSKKAHAVENLRENPLYHAFGESVTGVMEISDDAVFNLGSSEHTKAETCYACHGTVVTVKGMKSIHSRMGEIDVPDLANWPNQGVGRGNPDGSRGACTACHPRHRFSIEVARKPYTCAQCHIEPDVPAFEVYKESKHGNIFFSQQHEWNWNCVPWKMGRDFQAPTCAACHNSLIVTPDDKVIAPMTHDFGARLWVRLFGLIYSHPQPRSGKTHIIKNKDGQPLPTSFNGDFALEYLLDKDEQLRRQTEMKKICQGCHNSDWVNQHFVKLDSTIAETDAMCLSATQVLQKAWSEGIASPSNPFDEKIERLWIKQWFVYANSVRYASAMGGHDYATFKNGWWELTANLYEMLELLQNKKTK